MFFIRLNASFRPKSPKPIAHQESGTMNDRGMPHSMEMKKTVSR